MQARARTTDLEELAVKKQDLVNAWLLLEKLVVSLDRIGSAYATASGTLLSEERLRQMHAEVGRFITDQILEDASRSRVPLGQYLPAEEAEAISDAIEYWRPSDGKSR